MEEEEEDEGRDGKGWRRRTGRRQRLGGEGGGREKKGRPGNRLPPCMGESSGEETPLTYKVWAVGAVLFVYVCFAIQCI